MTITSMLSVGVAVSRMGAAGSGWSTGAWVENPGDCTKEQHAILNDAVSRACKSSEPMRCEPWHDCATLLRSANRFNQCVVARIEIMDRCYKGGDAAHKGALEQALNGLRRCGQYLTEKGCPCA